MSLLSIVGLVLLYFVGPVLVALAIIWVITGVIWTAKQAHDRALHRIDVMARHDAYMLKVAADKKRRMRRFEVSDD
ncbi:hypothetical protein QEH32_gp32 [Corynebacterium phage EmiRose]|uniref:Uncharacterized protein n=1 Tax=Corynebacterium phage EmiRose TaxID=2565372 RepID=A0A649VPP6_9CAUD|nr:hypothetical protein QEH32_gp32 [Corynebacterium phage EmiRose]QGJ94164.1 hypothetical protein SEA_EMIROSE_32 [Corynebacterium phage EmiRose]